MKFHMTHHYIKRQRATICNLGIFTLMAMLSALPPTQAHAQAASTDAARDALSKKAGDVDSATLLKDTLSATDKQYSLLREGKYALTYDLTYSYIGQQLIDANFTDQKLTNFKIQNTRGHTITNTFSGDYGLKNNLTLNLTVPVVSKFSQTDENTDVLHGFGDISVGALSAARSDFLPVAVRLRSLTGKDFPRDPATPAAHWA